MQRIDREILAFGVRNVYPDAPFLVHFAGPFSKTPAAGDRGSWRRRRRLGTFISAADLVAAVQNGRFVTFGSASRALAIRVGPSTGRLGGYFSNNGVGCATRPGGRTPGPDFVEPRSASICIANS